MERGRKIIIAACILSIILGILILPNHSPAGVLTVFLGLLSSYFTSIIFFRKIHAEKLAVVSLGIFFSYVALFGFLMEFLGLDISSTYFLIIFALLSIIFFLAKWKNRLPPDPIVEYDRWRIITITIIFLVSFGFYLYPALPSMVSPCTPGFDCSHHIEYAQGIFEEKKLVPPVDVWEDYPFGLHVNVALLADSLTGLKPSATNVFYPFMVFVTALSVAMTCGILLDRGVHKIYSLILTGLLLFSVYPASALIGYGFWAQVFGVFFIILFFWLLGDYLKGEGRKMVLLLGLLTIASFLTYQVLVAMPIIFGFAAAVLFSKEIGLKKKVVHLFVFLSLFLLVFSMSTFENYSRYLKSDFDIFSNTPTRYSSINMTAEERHSINSKSFQAFQLVYRRQLEQGGSIIFYESAAGFGVLIILLALLAVVCSKELNASVVFFVSLLFEMGFFSLGYNLGYVSLYYLSKVSYIMIYPITLMAVLGFNKVIDCWGILNKPFQWEKIVSWITIAAILTAAFYCTLLYKNVDLLFGERKQVLTYEFEDTLRWPLVVFNRIDYYHALSQHREPLNYTFFDWLKGEQPPQN